eukprot:scaffold990_cov393-Prasinococcus_capsulatus_cf.AAC.48
MRAPNPFARRSSVCTMAPWCEGSFMAAIPAPPKTAQTTAGQPPAAPCACSRRSGPATLVGP